MKKVKLSLYYLSGHAVWCGYLLEMSADVNVTPKILLPVQVY